jgi:uncharacterized protein YyaL (SSP411 family)
MERETFADEEAAAQMNAHFVNIKVDREERPDIDHVYMEAVQLMTRKGGWPLHCVALPDGRPVWGGTYFPKAQWLAGLAALTEVWASDPERVIEYAGQLARAVQTLGQPSPIAPPVPDFDPTLGSSDAVEEHVHTLWEAWQQEWDPIHGGRMGSPKFPLPCQLDFLLSWTDGRSALADAGRQHALQTLRGIERGGIHDHVGGGFARYSVDERWHVPHFEKMLYDNAQLLVTMAEAWAQTGDPALHRAALRCAHWIMTDLDHPSGGFQSAMDADSDGAEGTYYVWRAEDLQRALPNEAERTLIERVFGIGGKSLWEDGKHVIQRVEDLPDPTKDPAPPPSTSTSTPTIHPNQAPATSDNPSTAWADLDAVLGRMAAWRDDPASGRTRPALDDKVITAWTALAVTGLVKAGRIMGQTPWIDRASKAGSWLCHGARLPHAPERLCRTLGNDHEGFAEDYAFTIEALIELHQTTMDVTWRHEARALMATAIDRFMDLDGGGVGGFWFTPNNGEALFARYQGTDDGVMPSANAVMAHNLWRLGWGCDIPAWRNMALALTRHHLLNTTHLSQAGRWARAWRDMSPTYATLGLAAPNQDAARDALQTWWKEGRAMEGVWVEAVWPGATDIPGWMDGKEATSTGEVRWFVCVEGSCGLPCASPAEAMAQWAALCGGDRRRASQPDSTHASDSTHPAP